MCSPGRMDGESWSEEFMGGFGVIYPSHLIEPDVDGQELLGNEK